MKPRFPPLLLITLSLASGCGGSHDAAPAAVPDTLPAARVHVEAAAAATVALEEETVGTVRAVKRALVEAKISGLILEMPVTQGQTLRAGDRVATLDVRDVQSRLDQARAQLEQARRDLERAKSLLGQNALSPQEFDAAQARERVASAAVTGAETMLGYGIINAPFDGVITRKLAEQGDTASPGKPLAEIEDPARLRLETDVPEALALGMTTGQKIPVHIPSLRQDGNGVVAEIAPVADPVSRTVRVKLDVDAAGGLRPGLFGRARIPAGTAQSLQVPASALVQRGQMELVFVARDGKASLRLVRAGRARDGKVEILSGLAAGEAVVTEGAAALRDGQRLEVKP